MRPRMHKALPILGALLLAAALLWPSAIARAQAPAPGPFNKTSPVNGATFRLLNLTLYWGASSGAEWYEYCYDAISDNQCNGGWHSVGLSTHAYIGPLSPGIVYFWQVRAVSQNPSGTRSYTYANGFSTAYWQFTTAKVPDDFAKLAPLSGSTNHPLSIVVSWNFTNNAQSFEYCYDTTNDNACASWQSVGSNTTATLSGLSQATTYYWQVRAVSPLGVRYADLGVYWSFRTAAPMPVFHKTAPANGATSAGLSLYLRWQAVSGASAYHYCYDTTNDNACSVWHVSTVPQALLTGLPPNTTYYWQVKATNPVDLEYADSGAYWHFTTASVPGPFGKSSPPNGATGQSGSLTLAWQASPGATYYHYCYDTSDNNACNSAWLTTTHAYAAISGLSANTTYYWQVVAISPAGSTNADGAFAAFWHFTTGVPGSFGKVTPANHAANILPTTTTLAWTASMGAADYEYCIATVNGCGNWTSAGTNLSVKLSGLAANTPYYWQVRAVNSFGTTYADGSNTDWVFTTAVPITATFRSSGTLDGWILESSELSGVGGSLNSTASTFTLGDDASRRQYRAILSFNTASLPDNAVIAGVTFKIRKAGPTPTNPFSMLGNIVVDVRKGAFSNNGALQLGDFQALANKNAVMTFTSTLTNGWYDTRLASGNFTYINKLGPTQFRLRFARDDDNDAVADYLRLYSGNYTSPSYRPTLVITYYVP